MYTGCPCRRKTRWKGCILSSRDIKDLTELSGQTQDHKYRAEQLTHSTALTHSYPCIIQQQWATTATKLPPLLQKQKVCLALSLHVAYTGLLSLSFKIKILYHTSYHTVVDIMHCMIYNVFFFCSCHDNWYRWHPRDESYWLWTFGHPLFSSAMIRPKLKCVQYFVSWQNVCKTNGIPIVLSCLVFYAN